MCANRSRLPLLSPTPVLQKAQAVGIKNSEESCGKETWLTLISKAFFKLICLQGCPLPFLSIPYITPWAVVLRAGWNVQSWMCLWSQCDGVKSVLCTCLLDRSTPHLHLWKPGYGSSVAGNLRTSPFHGHKKCRAPTPRFHSTVWGRQNKVSGQWFQPDTTLYLKIPNEGDFPGSFPKRWYLMCLLHQRFLSDVLPVRCGRLGQ